MLHNADGGGRVSHFQKKSVKKVYGLTLLELRGGGWQGWVQLHKITSITIIITLKYELQLQLLLNVNFNYNYTTIMLYSITITPCSIQLQLQFNFLRKLHFYLLNFGLIDFSCFPCLACCF